MSSLYAQTKAAFHPDRIEDLRAGRRPKPVHVQLILSDLCNQDCGFCAYRMSSGLSNELFADEEGRKNPHRMIPVEKALEIVEDCAALGVKAIQFTGGGEPTVHPHHLEVIQRAQALGMDTGLVTNGVKLDPSSPVILALTWIRVSVDAGDMATYAKVRNVPPQHWNKAWANIRGLRANRYSGTLGIGFVATPENYRGMAECAGFARDAGADNLRIGAVFSADGADFYGDLLPRIADAAAAVKALLERPGFEVLNLFDRRIGDLEGGSPTEAVCNYQFMTIYVGGDLSTYRCCNLAYSRAGTTGSLKDGVRFRDLMRFDYDTDRATGLAFDARNCRYCQFQGQNAAIAALINEPTHVNFV